MKKLSLYAEKNAPIQIYQLLSYTKQLLEKMWNYHEVQQYNNDD